MIDLLRCLAVFVLFMLVVVEFGLFCWIGFVTFVLGCLVLLLVCVCLFEVFAVLLSC